MTVAKKRNISYDKLSKVANALKTISHPVRLEILEILEVAEPLTVSEIQKNLEQQVEQSSLSHHLSKMKDRGILKSDRKGKNIYYSIIDRTVINIFDCMQGCNVF